MQRSRRYKEYGRRNLSRSEGEAFGYWIPVANKSEWIIHCNVGLVHDYDEMIPAEPIQITDLNKSAEKKPE